MHFLRINLLIIILILFNTGIALSQNPKKYALDPSKQISDYSFKIWRPDNHFIQNQISAITQTEDGLLIVGTSNGLFRFDGTNFFNIELGIEDITQNIVINTLLRVKNNLIWVGTSHGIVLLKDLKPVKYEEVKGVTDCDILSICQINDSTVWFGTNNSGLIKYSNGKFSFFYSKIDYLKNVTVFSLSVDSKNNLWVATHGCGVLKIGEDNENDIVQFTEKNGLVSNRVFSVYVDANDTVYIGYITGKMDIMYNEKLIINRNISLDYSIRALMKDSWNSLWIATMGNGLKKIANGKISSFSLIDGLPNDDVLAFFEDHEGSLWVGTKAGYLVQFRNTFMNIITPKNGLANSYTISICEGKNEVIWVSTSANNINKIQKNKISAFSSKNGLPNSTIHCLHEDKNGTLWVGTGDKGLYKLENNRFIPYKKELLGSIRAFLETKDSSLYISCGANVFIIKGDEISELTPLNKSTVNLIRTMLQDKKGNLWIGGSYGINIYSNDQNKPIQFFDTLSNKIILSLYEDKDETIWIGTYAYGLFRYKDGKFTRFSKEEGLLDNVIYSIFEDKNSNLWMSTNFGIFSIKKEYLDDYADGKINTINKSNYILVSELLGIECNGGSQPSGCIAKSGNLWFPSVIGVIQIDPEAINIDEKPPKPIITGISTDGKWEDLYTPISLPRNTERIEFHFTAPTYHSSENIKFKYKLESFDKDWVDAGSQKIAYYTNIPSGSYEFKVTASNGFKLWSDGYATINLYKEAYFYETIWFYMIILILILFIIYVSFKLRLQYLTNQKNYLAKLVDEKTKELKESEERLKILNQNKDTFFTHISHDLKNVLMSLKGYSTILINDISTLSKEEITKFSININKSVIYLYNLTNNLLNWSKIQLGGGKDKYNPIPIDIWELVENALFSVKINAETKNITTTNLVKKNSIAFADEMMVSSILNNLIGNSIKFTRQGGQIKVLLSNIDDYYKITVSDNGVGMDPDTLNNIFKIESVNPRPGTDHERGTGLGLILCKDFCRKNKGDIWVESLYGEGTSIHFTLPKLKLNLSVN